MLIGALKKYLAILQLIQRWFMWEATWRNWKRSVNRIIIISTQIMDSLPVVLMSPLPCSSQTGWKCGMKFCPNLISCMYINTFLLNVHIFHQSIPQLGWKNCLRVSLNFINCICSFFITLGKPPKKLVKFRTPKLMDPPQAYLGIWVSLFGLGLCRKTY